MWKHLGPVDVLDLSELLDAIGSRAPAPGGGSAAALVGAMAAALCTKGARFTNDEGAVAQGRALERRLLRMAPEDAKVFEDALRNLDEPRDPDPDRRDYQLGRSLAAAAEVPLRIAESCADVALLAAELAERGRPELQADAAAAAVLAEAAARVASHLVAVNLGTTESDDRVRRAERSADAAGAAAARTGA
jgi:formiminotetrahydrofolate cyclodeaminase